MIINLKEPVDILAICLLGGGPLYILRGKVLGGSSCINAMIYQPGHSSAYDAWGETNPDWSYADMLPFFKKSEDNSRGESTFTVAMGRWMSGGSTILTRSLLP